MILVKKFALLEHGQSASNADGIARAETQVTKSSMCILPVMCMLVK